MKYLLLIEALFFLAGCQQGNRQNTVPYSATAEKDVKPPQQDTSSLNNSHKVSTDTIVNEAPANKVILPGKSLGNIEIGMDDSKLEVFGKPDMSDAAMGKAWLTWYGKKPDEHNNKTQLNVYTAYKDTGMRAKTVQQIRTTSSFFETVSSLHVYTSLHKIRQQFPRIEKVATYTDDGKRIDLYDARQQGIAFEIATASQQPICTGIIIHKPGSKVTQVYISLHPDMHLL